MTSFVTGEYDDTNQSLTGNETGLIPSGSLYVPSQAIRLYGMLATHITLDGEIANDNIRSGTEVIRADVGATGTVAITVGPSGILGGAIRIDNVGGPQTSVENAGYIGFTVLGPQNDTYLILGGGSFNRIDAGPGIDLLDFQSAQYLVQLNINLSTGDVGYQARHISAFAFENLNASSGDDTVTGTADANVLNGMAGNDIIDGGSGNDTIDGGAGNDSIDGGAGIDTASYASATQGVYVALLLQGTGQTTQAAGTDTLGTSRMSPAAPSVTPLVAIPAPTS